MFWEAVNAIGVLKSPAIVSIWDDGYGISVPNAFQHTKANVGVLLEGFRREPGTKDGYDIHRLGMGGENALHEGILDFKVAELLIAEGINVNQQHKLLFCHRNPTCNDNPYGNL